MHEETKGSKIIKWILIGISLLFVVLMLVLPLATVITEALKSGWQVFWQAVSDEYTVDAILLTLEATGFAVLINTVFGVFAAWAITKFRFKGKKLLTTLIDLPVTVSPVIAGLIFVLTFGRQSPLYPVLQALDIKIIFAVPGIILATVLGEFGAVSVISGHLRGQTNTLPLHVEILFNEFKYVPAFAVSAILVIMAVVILIIRSVVEYKGKKES